MADITPQERFRGCLLAGAAGDALGAPVEFMSRADILRHFSAAGITAFAPGYERVGAITDDTQMTLFTAAGLLAAWSGDGDVVRATARSYLAWLRTQDEWPYDPLLAAEEPSGWLWQQPE
ncbi:MAG: ADP-ribosylglycohydrolase family protein, partial [Cardiobacterium hominis]